MNKKSEKNESESKQADDKSESLVLRPRLKSPGNGLPEESNQQDSKSQMLVPRPRSGFPLIVPIERLSISRRGFIAAATVAAAGTLMIQPLHAEAKWWKDLLSFFSTFAQGILFSHLRTMLTGGLGDLIFANNMKFMTDGSGSFKREQATPNDPVKSYIEKLLSQVGNSPVDTAFAYIQKWLDKGRKRIPTDLPIPYLNGPAMTSLGIEGLVEAYLSKYAGKPEDFLASLMLPTFNGSLIDSGLSTPLLSKPPDFATKFDQIHEMESGTIVVVTYEPQGVVRDKQGVVDRGQGQSVLYVVPSVKSDNPDLRDRFKEVRKYIQANSNYWTNEAKRKEFLATIKSLSVIQPKETPFNFQNNR